MSSPSLRKIKKPMIERRRRERINDCLNQLKAIVLEAMNKDESSYSKMEKADILEMTVKHLREIHRRWSVAVTSSSKELHDDVTPFSPPSVASTSSPCAQAELCNQNSPSRSISSVDSLEDDNSAVSSTKTKRRLSSESGFSSNVEDASLSSPKSRFEIVNQSPTSSPWSNSALHRYPTNSTVTQSQAKSSSLLAVGKYMPVDDKRNEWVDHTLMDCNNNHLPTNNLPNVNGCFSEIVSISSSAATNFDWRNQNSNYNISNPFQSSVAKETSSVKLGRVTSAQGHSRPLMASQSNISPNAKITSDSRDPINAEITLPENNLRLSAMTSRISNAVNLSMTSRANDTFQFPKFSTQGQQCINSTLGMISSPLITSFQMASSQAESRPMKPSSYPVFFHGSFDALKPQCTIQKQHVGAGKAVKTLSRDELVRCGALHQNVAVDYGARNTGYANCVPGILEVWRPW